MEKQSFLPALGAFMGTARATIAARGLARAGLSGLRWLGRAWKGGLKSDVSNVGKFFRNPIGFGKNLWKTSGKLGKATAFGFPAWELSHGRPGQAAGWFVAPTAMFTKEVAGAAKTMIKKPKGKYFG